MHWTCASGQSSKNAADDAVFPLGHGGRPHWGTSGALQRFIPLQTLLVGARLIVRLCQTAAFDYAGTPADDAIFRQAMSDTLSGPANATQLVTTGGGGGVAGGSSGSTGSGSVTLQSHQLPTQRRLCGQSTAAAASVSLQVGCPFSAHICSRCTLPVRYPPAIAARPAGLSATARTLAQAPGILISPVLASHCQLFLSQAPSLVFCARLPAAPVVSPASHS